MLSQQFMPLLKRGMKWQVISRKHVAENPVQTCSHKHTTMILSIDWLSFAMCSLSRKKFNGHMQKMPMLLLLAHTIFHHLLLVAAYPNVA